MGKKLVLFDADETLWTSADGDYISSIKSRLVVVGPGVIVRQQDNKIFKLKDGVLTTFSKLSQCRGLFIGIVSDNHLRPVKQALELFGLWTYVNPQAFNVRLWQGYCPKHEMVLEVISKPLFASLARKDIYLVDDKDYSKEAQSIGIKFVRVSKCTGASDIIQAIVG